MRRVYKPVLETVQGSFTVRIEITELKDKM
jgi:hypothetical protein